MPKVTKSSEDGGGVSFTDTNAETGATVKKGAGTTTGLASTSGTFTSATKGKKSKASSRAKSTSREGGKKKKKGKKGKTKTKYVQRLDKYESQNYLFRVEGAICCGALISTIIFLVLNLIVLFIVMIWSDNTFDHLFNKTNIVDEEETTSSE